MYEVLSGKPAFSAQYGIDYLNKHLSGYPPRLKEVDRDLDFPTYSKTLSASVFKNHLEIDTRRARLSRLISKGEGRAHSQNPIAAS